MNFLKFITYPLALAVSLVINIYVIFLTYLAFVDQDSSTLMRHDFKLEDFRKLTCSDTYETALQKVGAPLFVASKAGTLSAAQTDCQFDLNCYRSQMKTIGELRGTAVLVYQVPREPRTSSYGTSFLEFDSNGMFLRAYHDYYFD